MKGAGWQWRGMGVRLTGCEARGGQEWDEDATAWGGCPLRPPPEPPGSERAMRRGAVRVVMFLLLGAVVNVGGAWGCAIGADYLTGAVRELQFDNGRRCLYLAEGIGWTRATIYDCAYEFEDPRVLNTRPIERAPYWCDLADAPPWWNRNSRSREFHGYGWPMRTMWFESQPWVADKTLRRSPMGTDGGVVLPVRPRYSSTMAHPVALPLRIATVGFAVNTMVYAGMAWMVFGLPAVVRRRRRVKQGRCVRCGYDMRSSGVAHSACPECGNAVS